MPSPKTKKRRRIYRRWWFWSALVTLIAFVVCVGPWPTYSSHYAGSAYAGNTFSRLAELPLETTVGPLTAGMATADITPPVGEPMAGFGARKPMESAGIAEPVHAKALSLSDGRRTVTIVTGDILLFMPELRDAVLTRLHLPREDIYFASTHTHYGPGGYASRWVDQLVLGRYDEKILNRLADAFAGVITRSRADMRPAEILFGRSADDPAVATTYIHNRIDNDSPPYGRVFAFIIRRRDNEKTIASVVVASTHPTSLPREERRIGGGYPGVVQQEMEKQFGGTCLFIAGAVGSMGVPESPHPRGEALRVQIGGGIFDVARDVIRQREAADGFQGSVALAAAILPVDLPPQQYHVWRVRLSPIAASYLHGRKSMIHVLRINRAVLLGMPCDFSGELAVDLEKQVAPTGLEPVVTSFNGDYIGYLVPRRRYAASHYETRDMNIFGPWAGNYFTDLSSQLIRRLAESGPPAGLPETKPE